VFIGQRNPQKMRIENEKMKNSNNARALYKSSENFSSSGCSRRAFFLAQKNGRSARRGIFIAQAKIFFDHGESHLPGK
jgi:hypothetical protein